MNALPLAVLDKGLEKGIWNLEKRFLVDATTHLLSSALAIVIVTLRRNGSDLDAGKGVL